MSTLESASLDKSVLSLWRHRCILFILLSIMAGLLIRTFYLQINKGEFLQRKGDARYAREIKLYAQRGDILDRNKEPLAVSTAISSIWANPHEVRLNKTQFNLLKTKLGISTNELNKKLHDKDTGFVYLKRNISPFFAKDILALHYAGIYKQDGFKRYYPFGNMVGQLLGMTSIDDEGQEGIELKYNEWLAGKNGERHVIKDAKGHIVEETAVISRPEEGHSLVLSIDKDIQYIAYQALLDGVQKYSARSGSVVVLDAKRGEILAMLSLPTYNPNNPQHLKDSLRNRVITDIFEPGSTIKPIIVAMGLSSKKFQENTIIQTEKNGLRIGNFVIRDSHPEAQLSVAQVIQRSSNIGATKISLAFSSKTLWETLGSYGFGRITGIEYPGEVSGKLTNYKHWQKTDHASHAYGYGLNVSLIQLARAYTVFANEGILMPVSLFKKESSLVGEKVLDTQTSLVVRNMMEKVTQIGGTAPKGAINGYRVAGKTGTVHKFMDGVYQSDKYIASFVGLAPASNPKLIVAVMLDEPNIKNNQYYGGLTAAPVFAKIMSASLRRLNIPYDSLPSFTTAAMDKKYN